MKVSCGGCSPVVINGTPTHEIGCQYPFEFRRGKKVFGKYRVWSLDVWGNRKDGFEVNDRSSRGFIMVADDAENRHVIASLKRIGVLNKYMKTKSFEIDGDEIRMDVSLRSTGEPILQLEAQ